MARLTHPYGDLSGGEWLRGNLHTHTTQSDGRLSPQAAIDDYAARGHGFLMISDHDVLTTEAAYRQWDNRGLILIPGNELAGGPHLLHVDADRVIPSLPSRQEILNRIVAAERETGRGFAIVNHPNWELRFDHCPIALMTEWVGYIGMEIYNGVIGRLDGSQYALDKWDLLLSGGRRVWGFANDDNHRGPEEAGLGWNVAYVRERTLRGVVDALRGGRFYASTGVIITSIRVDGTRVRIETENARRIVGVQNVGKRFAVVDGPAIEVDVPAGARYARFECWGCGEQMAWTQPFWVEAGASDDGPVATPFIREWRVTPLVDVGTLAEASPDEAARLFSVPSASQDGRSALPGFLDARPQIQGRAGIVYLMADVRSPAAAQGILGLGYDGPVRVWLNAKEIFHGPGTNPAVPNQLKLFVRVKRGVNRLIIALDTNNGKAWGIFGRVDVGGKALA